MSFQLYADKNKLYRKDWETVTSGSVNVYAVRFHFSSDWDGLTKTAVFKSEGTLVEVPLDEGDGCIIPREVLTKHGIKLYTGVYGTRGADTVLPTMWVFLGEVLEGAEPNTGSTVNPPSGGVAGPPSAGGSGGIPSGCILIWSGSSDNIPDGFALCDGENGTPDLRGRFVLGFNDKYEIGTVGGEEEHILTVDEMPGHLHQFENYSTYTSSLKQGTTSISTNLANASPQKKYNTTYTGSNNPHNNMPPYYALCYIMKL